MKRFGEFFFDPAVFFVVGGEFVEEGLDDGEGLVGVAEETEEAGVVFEGVDVGFAGFFLVVEQLEGVGEGGLVVVEGGVAFGEVVVEGPEPAALVGVGVDEGEGFEVVFDLFVPIGVGDGEHVDGVDGVAGLVFGEGEVVGLLEEGECLQGLAGGVEDSAAFEEITDAGEMQVVG